MPACPVAPACTSRSVLQATLTAFLFDDGIPALPQGSRRWKILVTIETAQDFCSPRSLCPVDTRTTNPSLSLAAPVHFAWEGGTTCSQESAPSSQTEGPLEMALPGLRLWAQRGSFFLLLAAELTSGGAGLPPPLLARLRHSLLRDGSLGFLSPLPVPTDAGYQQTEEALFTIFFFFSIRAHQKKKSESLRKSCVTLYNLLCQFI